MKNCISFESAPLAARIRARMAALGGTQRTAEDRRTHPERHSAGERASWHRCTYWSWLRDDGRCIVKLRSEDVKWCDSTSRETQGQLRWRRTRAWRCNFHFRKYLSAHFVRHLLLVCTEAIVIKRTGPRNSLQHALDSIIHWGPLTLMTSPTDAGRYTERRTTFWAPKRFTERPWPSLLSETSIASTRP